MKIILSVISWVFSPLITFIKGMMAGLLLQQNHTLKKEVEIKDGQIKEALNKPDPDEFLDILHRGKL